MAGKVIRFFGEIAKEIGISTVVHKYFESGKAAEHLEEAVKKTATEHRGELLAFFLTDLKTRKGRDGTAAKTLLRRQKERQQCLPPYKPNDENVFVAVLWKLKVSLQEKKEQVKLLETFETLANMPDEEFDTAIEFLRNDWVVQGARRTIWEAADAFNRAGESIRRATPRIEDGIRRLDRTVGPKLQTFQQWLEGKGIK